MGIFGIDFHLTEGAKTYAPVIHQPFEQFAPQYQQDYIYAPSVQIDSPGAQGPIVTTKKEAMSTPYIGGPEVVAPTQGGSQSDPTGMILILGLVAVGGYVLSTMIKKKA